ncbi:hypothetical protein H7U19_11440 [Hyunsoonleella sp. SJ7]|uniref:Uncharacterized protein n=1 Tax=Hyunsoonleella aquatilis TaxID=2762758 RepID=A0A923KLN9_9FLAO|nr:hypothetical protein [Hyunsoonleella aquatilis]MBC3759023.1 hypothetical protein [Hyunsoonleella aquatilis]
MKKNLLLLLCVTFLVFACKSESVEEQEQEQAAAATEEVEMITDEDGLTPDGEEDLTLIIDEESENFNRSENMGTTFSVGMSSNSSKSGTAKLLRECKVIDADRDPWGAQEPTANFWWSKTADGSDYFDPSTYFSTKDDHKLRFYEYDNGTANIKGTTVYGTCVVTVNVWLKNKKSWAEWSADGGGHKKEGTAGDASNSEDMHFYVIDHKKSTIIAEGGDCVQEGTFGVEQRPDPNDDNTPNYGVHIGPGGANYDSHVGAHGLAGWGWLIDKVTCERLWLIDFNFRLDCETVEECKPCKGDVDKLTLKFNWCKKKRVKVFQKLNNSCRGAKIFDGYLKPGEEFMIEGANHDGSFGKYVYFYINNCYYTKINTNCWTKIGPGYKRGVFKVVSGTSTQGGELCEYEPPKKKYWCWW